MTHVFSPITQCRGKRQFDTKADALAFRALERYYQGPNNLIAYACPHCSAWHLGHAADIPKAEDQIEEADTGAQPEYRAGQHQGSARR